MAEFQIKDMDQLYNAAYDMANYSSKVRKAKESAMSVRRNLAYNGAAYNSIRSSIQSIIGSLDEEIESLISVSSGLENIRSNYNSTERSIIENATGVPSNYGSGSPINKDNLDKILASEASKLTTDEINSVLRLLLNQEEKDTEQLIEKMLLLKPGEESVFFGLYKLVNKSDSDATMLPIEDSYAEFAGIFASSALAAFFVQNSSDELKTTFGESEFEKDSYIKNKWSITSKTDNGNGDDYVGKLTDDNMKTSSETEVFKVGSKDTLKNSEIKSVFEIGPYKIAADVGKSEITREISAGLYEEVEDGKRVFSPKIKADLGGSYTMLDIALEPTKIGSEDLGYESSAKLKVLDGGLETKNKVEFFDKDGHLNPSLKTSLKAEAVAVEVENTLKGKVLGSDISATGSLKVGMGGHFDVKVEKGKIKVDVGAALGFGASLKFEADVSGTIDRAKSALGKLIGSLW